MKRRFAIAAIVVGVLFGLTTTAQAQTIDQTLVEIRADYPDRPSLSQVGEMMNRVVYEHRVRYRLLLKQDGTRCPSPAGTIACDIIIDVVNGHHYDILGDADGAAVPIPMVDKGLCVISATSRCSMEFAVPAVRPEGVPEPTPIPQPPPVDLTPILTRLDEQNRLIQLLIDKPCAGIGKDEYNNLIRIMTADRKLEIKGNWMVGTMRGIVFGGGQ